MLKKVTTTVTYKVPDGHYCDILKGLTGKQTVDKCRFCVKQGKGYVCALYNTTLAIEGGTLAVKTNKCERATAGFPSVVKDSQEIHVDPQKTIKLAIAEYDKVRKQLLNQGYPAVMADNLAKDYVLGGK